MGGDGGQCCGNACAAPGSKCCESSFVEKSRWYPVTKDTECAFTGGPQDAPTTCSNRWGAKFLCAGGDSCCGDVCVGKGDVCCENVDGNFSHAREAAASAVATHARRRAASVASPPW